jgi:hypothetical protein
MPDVSNITANVNASDLQWSDCQIESAGPGEAETILVQNARRVPGRLARGIGAGR